MARKHPRERLERVAVRRQGRRQPYDRVLIVCEGQTEVQYFNAIRQSKRLSNTIIKAIQTTNGTEPLQIVGCAIEKFSIDPAFDRVYSVFDRDVHLTYHNALSKVEATDKKLKNDNRRNVVFKAIPSVPDFELWILLHFREVQAPMQCDQVFSELLNAEYYPAYVKNCPTLFRDTYPHIQEAGRRAKKLRERFSAKDGSDPYTDVDILTELLLSMPERF